MRRCVYINDDNLAHYLYRDDRISNRKYTIWNFLPKNLWEQFSRLMNQYFLLIACLQLWPLITPVNPASTWGPLIFIFATKEAWDNYNRYISDKKANEKEVWIVRQGNKKMTAALDVETDLKTRVIPSACMGMDFELLHKIKESLDIVKSLHAKFIYWDDQMADLETGTPSHATNTAISEDLGQVEYILTDKTRTLTENKMVFRRCCISESYYSNETGDALTDAEMLNAISSGSPYVMQFLIMAICNTVIPVESNNGAISYKAQSQDEEALVRAASQLLMVFVNKSGNIVGICCIWLQAFVVAIETMIRSHSSKFLDLPLTAIYLKPFMFQIGWNRGTFDGLKRWLIFVYFILVCTTSIHGSGTGQKVLCVGVELFREMLPLQNGACLYQLQGLKPHTWYEVKISYPASIPSSFTLQLIRGNPELTPNRGRKLLNVEKLIFKTGGIDSLSDQSEMSVLVNVVPEGFVAIPGKREQEFVIFNIVCDELLLGIPHQAWYVVVLVVFCLIFAFVVPSFLPPLFMPTKGTPTTINKQS